MLKLRLKLSKHASLAKNEAQHVSCKLGLSTHAYKQTTQQHSTPHHTTPAQHTTPHYTTPNHTTPHQTTAQHTTPTADNTTQQQTTPHNHHRTRNHHNRAWEIGSPGVEVVSPEIQSTSAMLCFKKVKHGLLCFVLCYALLFTTQIQSRSAWVR